jgi:eukaryotic-like serine/threonine-protein kinase
MSNLSLLHFAHFEVRRQEDGAPWELGRGAMGVTYKAYDPDLRVYVALKVINPAQVGDAKARALFLREARAAARVHHANVGNVVFLNPDPENMFYAMEFIAGESLRDWLHSRVPLTPLMAVGLSLQIACGLEAIHREEVIHRDLKPTNLMIVRADKQKQESDPVAWLVKIIDFGLARNVSGDVSETSAVAGTTGFRGTALYASPEQCEERRDLDGRADLYSLGCVMWEMLVGMPPFSAKVHREMLNAHVAKPPPLQQLSHLPTSLQAVVARLLLKDREARFADAGALIRALEKCREQILRGDSPAGAMQPVEETTESTTVLPEARPSTSVPLGRKRKRGLAVSAVALLLLIAFGSWWIGMRRANLAAIPVVGAASTVTQSNLKPSAPAVPEKSIAVLPFESLGNEGDNKTFADAIQEEILTDLTGIADLKVIARSSVMRYRDPTVRKFEEIGRELGVAYLAEGTVQRAGDKVRVSAQLIDARTGTQVWAERYDRNVADIFAIQSDVAKSIAGKLKARLTPAEKLSIDVPPTKDLVAYDYYLRAKDIGRADISLIAAAGEEGSQRIQLLEEALVRDPNFLAAHWLMAHGAAKYALNAKPEDRAKFLAKAEASVAAAQRLAPDAPETRLAQAQYYYYGTRNFGLSRREVEGALALQPNNADAWFLLGILNKKAGRMEEARTAMERAHQLDPTNVEILSLAASPAYMLRQFNRARELHELAAKLSNPPQRWEFQLRAADCERAASGNIAPRRQVLNQILQENPGPLTEEELADWVFDTAFFEKNVGEMERLLPLYATAKDTASRLDYVSRQIAIAQTKGDAKKVQELARSMIPDLVAEAEKEKSTKRELRIAGRYQILSQMRALAGEKAQAIADAKYATELVPYVKGYVDAVGERESLAAVYALVGERAAALDVLEELVGLPGGSGLNYGHLLYTPDWDSLRKEPRFQALLARLAPKDSMRK